LKLILSNIIFILLLCFTNKVFSQLNISGSVGLLSQNFSWSVAGNYAGQNPNIYSELTWKKLEGTIYNIDAEYRIHNRFFISSSFRYASINSGTITDADYESDNRTDRSYFAQFSNGNSKLVNSGISAGYLLIKKKKVSISAFLGYSYQNENLSIRPGKEDSSIITTGLNSSYAFSLYGPHISTRLLYNLSDKLNICYLINLQLINYVAKADWNLATSFQHPVSFRQLAAGYILNNELKIAYRLSKRLSAIISTQIENLKTSGGDDVLYKSSGDILISHFNGAEGKLVYALVGVTYVL
jgi:hypothetical protein